jgi:sugar fermentation stimulation protein A
VHLRRSGGLAEFPDSVTARGAKHLRELAAVAAAGGRAVMLYVVQRTDCDRFGLAADIDPAYAAAFAAARAAGVEAIAHATRIGPEGVELGEAWPVEG